MDFDLAEEQKMIKPNAGSDAATIETTAALDGNEWVINA